MRTSVGILVLFVFVAQGALAQVGDGDLTDPNLARQRALERLPGVTETVAEAIIAGRPYRTAGELDAVLAPLLDETQRAAVYAVMFRQIDLNSAPREEIMLVPGMDAQMAAELEAYRPYADLEHFRREIGKTVDEGELARLEQYVFVPINLNTSSPRDISTIPGMHRRMILEFEEYRPYTSMEQFRREIGKYVDDDEVARLESYVILE